MAVCQARSIVCQRAAAVPPRASVCARRPACLHRGGPAAVLRSPSSTPDSSFTDPKDDAPPSTSAADQGDVMTLFDTAHVTKWTPALVAYAPFGFVLATFRSALWILCVLLDHPLFQNERVIAAYFRLLGVSVAWRNAERLPAGRHLLVSNHVTVGDMHVLFLPPNLPPGQRYTFMVTPSLPARVTSTRNLPVRLRAATATAFEEIAAESAWDTQPIHLCPEGGMTNGTGMLAFARGFVRIMQQPRSAPASAASAASGNDGFAQHHAPQQPHHVPQHAQGAAAAAASAAAAAAGSSAPSSSGSVDGVLPVVPLALRVRGLPEIRTHTLSSSFLANLFWLCFSPTTHYEATVLPPMTPLPGEPRGTFVKRVQAAIAQELGVKVYEITIQQKKQLAQRRAKAKGGQ